MGHDQLGNRLKGVFDAENGFGKEEWAVFRIDKSVPNELRLWWINLDHEAWEVFDDIDEEKYTRRKFERVIRKHAKDEGFYDEELISTYYRIKPEHYDLFDDFISDGMFE